MSYRLRSVEERLTMINGAWEHDPRCLTDGDVGWLIGQLRESLAQTTYYKAALERLERECKQ